MPLIQVNTGVVRTLLWTDSALQRSAAQRPCAASPLAHDRCIHDIVELLLGS
jgi:hypothetical protein